MNERNVSERIVRAVDARLSGLTGDPWMAQHVLARAEEELPNRRKKRAVALIVAAVLALAGMGALAASLLWREQAASMKQVEQTEGDYAGWAIEDKAALVRALVDSGYLAQGGETERLFDEGTPEAERHAIADALLLALTGQTEVAEISVDIITYAVMGAEDTWTPEERAWWQQVTRQFDGDDGADDTFLVPDGSVISEAQAVAAARTAILSAQGLEDGALDAAQPVADLYVTQQQPDRPRWNVQFKFFREGSDSYVERVYSAVVDARSGEVISDPDTGVPHPDEAAAQQSAARPDTPLFQAIDAMAESVQRDIASFGAWPLSLKAEYARDIAPRVRAIVDSGDLTPLDNGAGPNLYVIAAATYDYGLPGEGDLAQEEALERAREAVQERFGLSQEALSRYTDVLVYFDATDPDAPLWRFVFQPEMDARDALGQTQYDLRYRVEIASPAGDVASAEAFKRQVPVYDLSYLMNLY